jgi:outer membrane protein
MPRARSMGALAGALLSAGLISACNDLDSVVRENAPATPDTPWQPKSQPAVPSTPISGAAPAVRQFTVLPNTELQLPSPAAIDPTHVYSLVELIDIAQRRNPMTRAAWEKAQQAAIDIGMARAAYLPVIAAGALAGDEYLVLPFPNTLIPKGFIGSNIEEVVPELTVKYLLFDFGGRAAKLEGARQGSIAANAAFTAAHQQLIFNVAHAYFALDAEDAAVRAARQALDDATVLQQSAEALFGRGVGTIVSVQLARRGTAQAQLSLSQANAGQQEAMYSLLEAMDLPPTTKLSVASASERPLPQNTSGTVDDLLNLALLHRADLKSAVAQLHAADADIAATRSESAPKIALGMAVQGNFSRMNVDGGPYLGVARPQGELLLSVTWPLFDGGLMQAKLKLAHSKRDAAADQLKSLINQALREVAMAHEQVDTGLQQYNAAETLQTASEEAFRSASESYRLGVGTFSDAMSAQAGLASARAAVAQAHAQCLVNAAQLAFATGLLTSSTNVDKPALP